MFVYIHARFCFVPIDGNLTAQSTGSHWGIGDKIEIPEMLLQTDYIFTKRQNLRFTGEEEKWASLVNMTLRLELSASHVAILTGNSPLTTSYFEPTDFKLQCSSELQDNSYINFLHLAQNYLFYCVLP